jgi:ABC-2 type transport system ATP-binding protein
MIDAGRLVLQETTDGLGARFRRVEVQLEAATPAAVAGAPLPTWWEWAHEGSRVQFVDSAFDAARTEAACRERFPAAQVRAQPMTLREIFISLARAGRRNAKGAAA